jgi:putative intracellular protease/amidase
MNARLSPNFGQSAVPTHTFETAPKDIEVLIVPGGLGLRDDVERGHVAEYLKEVYPRLRWILTVCTGSVPLAMSGILDGKRATTNKKGWVWVSAQYFFKAVFQAF